MLRRNFLHGGGASLPSSLSSSTLLLSLNEQFRFFSGDLPRTPRMPGSSSSSNSSSGPNIKIGGFANEEQNILTKTLNQGRPTIRPVTGTHHVSDRSGNAGGSPENDGKPSDVPKPFGGKREPSKADSRGFRLMNLMQEGIQLNEQRHALSTGTSSSAAAMPFVDRKGKPKAPNDGTFFGKMRVQPINPLFHDLPVESMSRTPPGKDRDAVYNPSTRKKLSTMKFTSGQTDAIIDAYAAKQWYGRVWKALKFIDPNRVRSWRRWCAVGFCASLFVVMGIVWYVYRNEMDLFVQMEPDEQRDFKKVIFGARMGEVIPSGEAALEKADPLRILPPREKMRIIINAWREAGLVDKDWELEARKRKSLFAEPDIHHMFYWFCLTAGRYLIGGGYLWWGLEEEQLKRNDRDAMDAIQTYDGRTGEMISTKDLGKQKAETGL